MRTPAIPLRWVALALITTLAAVLRLVDLGAVRLDPFYDAAVRSMSLSWHNFFLGAYEPGGSVSIDKPPVDLWLQVASVKLFGWSSTSLKLPEALAGTASVPLLYAALRGPFGALAGLVGAAALAVLPIEVITARSDTMDAVMMMLLVVALLAVVRAGETGRTAWLLAAGAALGLAFNVKLLESFVALPGLVVIVWLGMSPPTGQQGSVRFQVQAGRLAAAGGVYIVVALAWLSATLLVPPHERPYAIGSTNGSAWNAAFVFNGTERLTGKTVEVGQGSTSTTGNSSRVKARNQAKPITPPSPTRLLARNGQLPARWLGWETLTALLLGGAALTFLYRRKGPHMARATATGLFVWLLTGAALFSAMARLHPRYVEGFTPAVAGMFGVGVASVANSGRRWRLLAVALVLLLVIPFAASIEAISDRTSDAGNVGALARAEQNAVSTYLSKHRDGARYELAAASATSIASLIVEDQQPIVMLTTYNGLPLTSVAQLRTLASHGEVRYAFLDSVCNRRTPGKTAGCSPAAVWVRSHGSDVSRQAGLSTDGVLWRLPTASSSRPASEKTHAHAGRSPEAIA